LITLAVLVAGVVALEIGLTALVRRLRRNFQWLITEADEVPRFDDAALKKFLDSSFDSRLGWVRRPNTTGREKARAGDITFHIDERGARASQFHGPPVIAAFGDSYVFCRQVEDDETWEEQLASQAGIGVMNFGVGNYGADQALLRYEETELPDSVQVAILGFVPETICRIQSYWKHYLEFGNTFAFKPRFTLKGGQLALHESPVRSREDFERIREKLPVIQGLDAFYRRKFRSVQFRFPYIGSFLRHPRRNTALLRALISRDLIRGTQGATAEDPFALVMRQNIRDAHGLFLDRDAVALLTAIVIRFREAAKNRGHAPLVLIMPQLIDLQLGGHAPPYRRYFEDLTSEIAVVDPTDALLEHDIASMYVEDAYGGHFSPAGNAVVAGQIAAWLERKHPAALTAPHRR
jgi:hypothetical protein